MAWCLLSTHRNSLNPLKVPFSPVLGLFFAHAGNEVKNAGNGLKANETRAAILSHRNAPVVSHFSL